MKWAKTILSIVCRVSRAPGLVYGAASAQADTISRTIATLQKCRGLKDILLFTECRNYNAGVYLRCKSERPVIANSWSASQCRKPKRLEMPSPKTQQDKRRLWEKVK